jgi:hypothetical protein
LHRYCTGYVTDTLAVADRIFVRLEEDHRRRGGDALNAEPADGNTSKAPFTTLLVTLLAAVGGSIGVLGFVTFIGAAVWFARFRGVGLSATFAVPHLSRGELLATGADQMLGPAIATMFVLSVAVAVLVVFRLAKAPRRSWAIAQGVLLAAGFIFGAIYYFPHKAGDPFAMSVRLFFAGAVLALIIGIGLATWLGLRAYQESPLATSGAFWGYLASIAAGVLVYGAFETYARNLHEPEVRPVAVLVKGDSVGVSGVYAGEDGDRVYLGIIGVPLTGATGKRSAARILPIDRAAITDWSVGGVLHPDPGDHRFTDIQTGLLNELVALRDRRR